MAKTKTNFVCTQCGYETGKWMGKCPGCGEWNTLEEQQVFTGRATTNPAFSAQHTPPVKLSEVELSETLHHPTGIGELDRVLGGGLIDGGVVLVGGEPGVGKSTLLLQACQNIAAKGRDVLYVSGEESAKQVKMRATRLGASSEHIYILAETNMEAVVHQMHKMNAPVVILDSIQTMFSPQATSAPGSVVQVRECASSAIRCAKENGNCVIMVGHVTKEGAIAGPRVLEHMVDTVLYFEGERQGQFRILRAVKNRFGSTNEIGVFEMDQEGMREVRNPSELFISRREEPVAGSAVSCAMEGTRPMLCEVQALVATTAFGQPRRTATGVDYNRMLMLTAVLERRAALPLSNQDIYINAAGGLKLNEPALDLCIAAAIASALRGAPIRKGMALIGEVGLTGEIRPVAQMQRRVLECAKLGFTTVLAPKGNQKGHAKMEGVDLIWVDDIAMALRLALVSAPKTKEI